MHLRRLLWLILLISPLRARAQTSSPAAPADAAARSELLSSFQVESQRGSYIFYTQTYSLHGRRVEFHGSIFGVIQEVQADGCKLKIKSEIFDHYSGNIGNKLVGQTQNTYTTSIDFKLTPKIAEALKIVDARPVRQLASGTETVCSGTQKCSLTWIKLKADNPEIQMTDITNDVADYEGEIKDFDGAVDQAYLPVSSTEAGNELVAKMRAFAQSCAH
jgi:hypothetical protein